jgi:hypothetical protein
MLYLFKLCFIYLIGFQGGVGNMFSGLNSQGGGPLASNNSNAGGGGGSIPGLSKFQELVYSTIQVI